MRIGDLIVDQVVARLGPGATALEAARCMAEGACGSVLVVDDQGRMLGIFTERDLMVRVVAAGSDPSRVPLGDVMTTEVVTTHPDRSVQEVRADLQHRHIRHIPVVAGDRVIAVLSMRDLMRADLREKRQDVRAMTAYIRGGLEQA